MLKIQPFVAHNPEVEGSSPSSATKNKPTDFNDQRVFTLGFFANEAGLFLDFGDYLGTIRPFLLWIGCNRS